MMHCIYYQAHIERANVWMFAAIVRSYEHLVFERTIDKQESIFEFFVPAENEKYFIELINFFEQKGIVSNFKKLPNRLIENQASV